MIVHKVIIHEITKLGGKTGAKLRSSGSLMDVSNSEVLNLIVELNNRYKNKNENYGVFDSTTPTRFHEEFKQYTLKPDDKRFLEFSINVSGDLREKIDAVAPAKGGYLVFSTYSDHRDFLGVFLIRDTQGTILRRNSHVESFDIRKVEHIDFEKMAMACRINLKAYAGSKDRYLSFINKKSDAISKYFTSWISSTDTESNQEDTLHLYRILKSLNPPKDESGKVIDTDEFLDSVYRHVKSVPDKQINLRELGRIFYKDENIIIDYADKNDILINTEFKGHPRALRRFIQVRATADHIELAFQHNQFKKVVRIVDNKQIVIDSPSLVDKVKQQIAGNE